MVSTLYDIQNGENQNLQTLFNQDTYIDERIGKRK